MYSQISQNTAFYQEDGIFIPKQPTTKN